MTNEELVVSYQKGNKQALEQLIENNKKFIYKVANKFYVGRISSIDKEDLIQEGTIGFIIACNKYDINKEKRAKFTTYAFNWIYSKIHRFITNRDTNDEMSLNVFVNDEGKNIEIQDLIKDECNDFCPVEERIYLLELRKELEEIMDENITLHERNILKLHYGWDMEPLNKREISDLLEISAHKVTTTEFKALGKIRRTHWAKEMCKEYYGSSSYKYRVVEKNIDFTNRYFKGVI